MSDGADRSWTDLELYVLQEHIEDWSDGLIGRRELLRRVTLMTGSLAATLALLPTLGCDIQRQAPAASQPTAPSASAAATAAATAFALPPAARTADGVTVRPDDARITASRVDVSGPDGAALIGYLARPKADGRYAGVLVVHENRGLTEHIRDVVRRVATAGFTGLAVDLLSRDGGADRVEAGAYSAQLSARGAEPLVADLRAALVHLRRLPTATDKLGAVGFCFGGGMVWNLVPPSATAALNAAVPFYGPPPSDPAVLASTKTNVLAVYAEQDTRITSSRVQVEEQLKKAAVQYESAVFPGVNHAFHNDTSERYSPDQSQAAWLRTVEWFRRYLAA